MGCSSPSPRQHAKNAVIAALTALRIITESASIPGATLPAVTLRDLIQGIEVSGLRSLVWIGIDDDSGRRKRKRARKYSTNCTNI